jgi:hypothetical protein
VLRRTHPITITKETKGKKEELNLVVWGRFAHLESGIGKGRLTKQVNSMYKLTNFHESVLTGLILSDSWLILSSNTKEDKTKLNARLGFKQSLAALKIFYI